MAERPLDGVRVLELGQMISGPFAGALLAYFGAEVIKIEPPEGDPLRSWRTIEDGTSLWWRGMGRNKQSVVVDLRTPEGAAIVQALCGQVDVVIENFRRGRLQAWGIDLDEIAHLHPQLIVARISGYGHTGPYRDRPGFASVCEAYAGLRHLIGEAGEMPLRANLSLGDTLTGLHTAFGIAMALFRRERQAPAGEHEDGAVMSAPRPGETLDVAISESVFNMLESLASEYAHAGEVRGPSGARLTGVVPSGTFACSDGQWIVIGANSTGLFCKLAAVVGHDAWIDDPALQHNDGRVRRAHEIEAAIEAWTRQRSCAEARQLLEKAGVPCAPIHDIADIAADPQARARAWFETVRDGDRSWTLPMMAPRLEQRPGRSDWVGPALGRHTDEVLERLLGTAPETLAGLRARGVIA